MSVQVALTTLALTVLASLPAHADPFDPASCSGATVTRPQLEAFLPGGVSRAALGTTAFTARACRGDGDCSTWRPARLELGIAFRSGAGDLRSVAVPSVGTVSIERTTGGPALFWRAEPLRTLGADGAYYEITPVVRCDASVLLGDLESPCAANAGVRKVGASTGTSVPLEARLDGAARAAAFRPRVTMTPGCARLAGNAGSETPALAGEAATLLRLPLFDFSLAALDTTLGGLAEYVYASKAPLFRRGADLAAQNPLPAGRDLRLFVMAALRPAVDTTSTPLFEERVIPAYGVALSGAMSAAGHGSLGDLPFTQPVRMATMWLLSTSLGLCKDAVSDTGARAVLDGAIARAGQALAREAPVDHTLAALDAAAAASPTLEALAAGGPMQSAALVAMILLEYGASQ